MNKATYICVAMILSGCTTTNEQVSMASGHIGCSPSEIQVSDGAVGWQTKTWTARCRGKTFYCTYTSSMNLGSGVQCKEEIAAK